MRQELREEKREIRREVRRAIRRLVRRRRPGQINPPGPPAPLSPGQNAALLQPLLGVGTGPAGAAGTITALNYTCQGNQNSVLGSTVSCTWSTQPPAGASILCGGQTWSGGTGTITGLTISDGNTYTSTNAGGSPIFNVTNQNYIVLAYRFNIGSLAPATVTMTIAGATDKFANIVCNAFTDTGTPTLDTTCSFATLSQTNPSSCSSPMITTGNDYVLATSGLAGGVVTCVTCPPFFIGSNSGGAFNQYIVQASPGSINPQYSVASPGTPGGILGAAIKP